MKRLLVVALLFCLVVLISGTVSAESELALWCSWSNGEWDLGSSTCTTYGASIPFGYGDSTLTIGETETLILYGGLSIYGGSGGALNNNGTIFNDGTINNYGGTLNNNGTIHNTVGLNNFYIHSMILNYGTINNKGFVFNQTGTIFNYEYGYIRNYRCPGAVGVIASGTSNIYNGGTLDYIVGKEECG